MLRESELGQVSMQAGRARPSRPQVPGAEFWLGVRWRPGSEFLKEECVCVCEKERQ